MPVLYSYIVAYDSGFAPNPFNGICTLATCKPKIRRHASVDDWIVGTGSDRKDVRRGGFLVYAMRVKEVMTFGEYWEDPRFEKKKPNLYGSYRMACGDNIYCPRQGGGWTQLNSYHSKSNGFPSQDHIDRDTSVDRVLLSDEFVYFGAEGPEVPLGLKRAGLVHCAIGQKKIENAVTIAEFEAWIASLGVDGYQGRPFDMI
ncbi:hypothetical protein [Thalassospira povalilytica]|uniref:Nucleotide modification associated domain-containing protein n=1 Tax=Thalassospira povalilytica TaxID=732237 RepID=A0A8I1M851_9PROT|nr:hypothetical protein [Thalassospira povalilytica]MBN8196863.1 hypothetical protein [Thalassospira povalilytica]